MREASSTCMPGLPAGLSWRALGSPVDATGQRCQCAAIGKVESLAGENAPPGYSGS
jgi:hypothetical protein